MVDDITITEKDLSKCGDLGKLLPPLLGTTRSGIEIDVSHDDRNLTYTLSGRPSTRSNLFWFLDYHKLTRRQLDSVWKKEFPPTWDFRHGYTNYSEHISLNGHFTSEPFDRWIAIVRKTCKHPVRFFTFDDPFTDPTDALSYADEMLAADLFKRVPYGSVIIPLLRRVMPSIIAADICGVQPMSGPIGQIYTLRSKYNGDATLPERILNRFWSIYYQIKYQIRKFFNTSSDAKWRYLQNVLYDNIR